MDNSNDQDAFLEYFLPGETASMRKLRSTIALVNRRYKNPPHMGRSLLLIGETGVGKNHVARVIAGHLYWLRDPGVWHPPSGSVRARTLLQVTAERFKEVALPNLPTELIESELFGHVKGSFTGAVADKDGFFCADEIEDLLLDEIGEAPPTLQAKLLQVLNDGTFKRVGAPPTETRSTEARIFLATNRDLGALVRNNQFRADLYWRVQHLVIRIPTLREQSERIPVLAESIVASILRNAGMPASELTLRAADLAWAQRQRWPGNVRELERLLWRWVYEEGKRTLEEVQREYPNDELDVHAAGTQIKALLRSILSSALERRERLSASVGEFTRGMERAIQTSLYELRDELPLDRGALSTLFGDGDRAAKQISAWGDEVRSR
jgi:transcriptional regulator with GAF, ATPase, and Fis domain